MTAISCIPTARAIPAIEGLASGGVTWGRKGTADQTNKIFAVLLTLSCPILLFFNWITLEKYNASFQHAFASARDFPLEFARNFWPRVTCTEIAAYIGWLLWQLMLYKYTPGGKCRGQLTPGGKALEYVNKHNKSSIWTDINPLQDTLQMGRWHG